MHTFLNKILDALFPTSCIICTRPGPDICLNCQTACSPAKPSNHDWIISLWDYHDPSVEKIIRHIKNFPNQRIASLTVAHLVQHLVTTIPQHETFSQINQALVIPIPIHRERFIDRGYNQSELVARELAHILKRSLVTCVLIKNKQTRKQGIAPDRASRFHNVLNTFSIKNSNLISERDIIIVDDVTTTGATLSEARKTLLAAGARSVVAITLAN